MGLLTVRSVRFTETSSRPSNATCARRTLPATRYLSIMPGRRYPSLIPRPMRKGWRKYLSACWGASSYIYAEAVWSQQLPNWIASHVRMFEHFGGVPQVVVCDNLKSAVTRASRTDPDVHPTYLDMASHYGTVIFPARPYKPRTSPRRKTVLIVERWIMFPSAQTGLYQPGGTQPGDFGFADRCKQPPFQKLKGCRREAFEKLDRPALKPLLQTRYAFTEFLRLRVGPINTSKLPPTITVSRVSWFVGRWMSG